MLDQKGDEKIKKVTKYANISIESHFVDVHGPYELPGVN